MNFFGGEFFLIFFNLALFTSSRRGSSESENKGVFSFQDRRCRERERENEQKRKMKSEKRAVKQLTMVSMSSQIMTIYTDIYM